MGCNDAVYIWGAALYVYSTLAGGADLYSALLRLGACLPGYSAKSVWRHNGRHLRLLCADGRAYNASWLHGRKDNLPMKKIGLIRHGETEGNRERRKIDQAQYRELEAFSKFSSDMDAVTAMAIDRGRKNNKLLIQPQYSPMPVGEMIAVLYCGIHSLMRDIEIDQVPEFQQNFLETLRAKHQADVIDVLASGKIDDNVTAIIEKVAADTVQVLKK